MQVRIGAVRPLGDVKVAIGEQKLDAIAMSMMRGNGESGVPFAIA